MRVPAQRVDVLIVGAGPVGLVTAAVLVECGLEVALIDEGWRPAVHSYAALLHPHALALLERLALADELIGRGRRVETVAFYEGDERKAELSFAARGAPRACALTVPQSVFEETLAAGLARRGLGVAWNHRLSAFDLSGDRVIARVDRLERVSSGYALAGTSRVVGGHATIEARRLIGADGHRSTVRRILGATFAERAPGVVVGAFELAGPDLPPEVRVVIGEGGIGTLWPLPGGRCRWGFELPAEPAALAGLSVGRGPLPAGGRAVLALRPEALGGLLARLAPWFSPAVRDLSWSVAVRFERRLAEPPGRTPVWLVGDAAHTTVPFGAWNMNCGLHEAAELAERLAEERESGRPAHLDDWGAALAVRWRTRLAPGSGFVAGATADDWVRRHAARLAECVPAAGRDLERLLAQIGLVPAPGASGGT